MSIVKIADESLLGNFLTFNDMSYIPKSKSGSVSDNDCQDLSET